VMVEGEFERFIRDTRDNDWLSYTGIALRKILKESDNWTKDWTTLFMRILGRIKKTYFAGSTANPADPDTKEEKVISLPLTGKQCMTVFFIRQKGGCLIYDFKIDEINK